MGEGCHRTASARLADCLVGIPLHASRETIYIYQCPYKLLLLSPQGVVWVYPLLRASTEHIQIVRGLRAGGI